MTNTTISSHADTTSVFVRVKEWRDKVAGSSYFSAQVQVNGAYAFSLPFQYGYGDQALTEALSELEKRGYVATTCRPFWALREQGIAAYSAFSDDTKRNVKAWGTILDD